MKRTVSIIICFILVRIFLSGCSSPTPSSEIPSESTEEPVVQDTGNTEFSFAMQEAI